MKNTLITNLSDCATQRTRSLARRTRLRGNTGQALVELAFMLPIFAVLLIGAAEIGWLAYMAIEVSNAAHAGAQYGSQSNATATESANITTAAENDAPNVSGLQVTPTYFCTCSSAPATQVSCSTVNTTCATVPEHSLVFSQVNTSATVTPPLHLPGFSTTVTLTGQAILQVQQ